MTNKKEYDNHKEKDFYKILSSILENINEDGSLGTSDYESWKCIMTTLVLDLFLSCDIEAGSVWFTSNGKKVEFTRVIQFLDNSIQESGEFGEDFWDACRLGLLINEYSLSNKFNNCQKLHNYIIQSIKNGIYKDKNAGWSGPGFYAISIDYLKSAKNSLVERENFL